MGRIVREREEPALGRLARSCGRRPPARQLEPWYLCWPAVKIVREFQIVEYEARHATAFRDLNLSWIEEYFEVEEVDRRALLEPEDTILRPGGAILVAEAGDEILGVCALRHDSPGRYEVTKMAVRRDLRGHGIGRRLLCDVITHARLLGAKELFIISNTVLRPAIHLYRQLGFAEVPFPAEQEYARGNIALELNLTRKGRCPTRRCS